MSTEEHITRLQEAGASSIERRLLESVAGDEMPEEKYRALVRWSEGAATAAGATSAGTARMLPLVKGLGLLALAAASVGAFAYVSSSRSGSASESQRITEAHSTSETREALPAPVSAGSADVVPVVTPDELPAAPIAVVSDAARSTAAPARSVAKKPVVDDASLAEQMMFIDSARTRLRQGDPRGALSVLSEYGRRYPEPAFREEATVLRVSAHAKAGDGAEARRLGEAFLRTHPAELYSRRVEGIVRSLELQENSR